MFIKTKENTPVNCCKNGERKTRASGKATGWAGAGLRTALHTKLPVWNLCTSLKQHIWYQQGLLSLHPSEGDKFTSAQFTDCHSFGLKNQVPFYSEWTLKIWHISDTRTCPSVLAKISSLSTTAVLHMPARSWLPLQCRQRISGLYIYSLEKMSGILPEDKRSVYVTILTILTQFSSRHSCQIRG